MTQTTTITAPDSLPWRVSADDYHGTVLTDVVGRDGLTICELNGEEATIAERAAYIVHAANLYPALVSVLTAIRRDASAYQWHKAIDAALTQAREPEGK